MKSFHLFNMSCHNIENVNESINYVKYKYLQLYTVFKTRA